MFVQIYNTRLDQYSLSRVKRLVCLVWEGKAMDYLQKNYLVMLIWQLKFNTKPFVVIFASLDRELAQRQLPDRGVHLQEGAEPVQQLAIRWNHLQGSRTKRPSRFWLIFGDKHLLKIKL